MKTKINPWWFIPVAVAAGMILGIVFFTGNGSPEHVHADEPTGTVYTCSMHPQIRRNEPGKCPICGMDLIPVSEAGETESGMAVELSGSAVRLGNVQTIQVGFSGNPEETLTLNGTVVPDENQVRSQSSHVAGRIERLYVNTIGEEVRRGQRIATLYSPQLIAAQRELLQAAEMKDTQPRLLEAAREKMLSLRLTGQQIEEILASGNIRNTMDIYAEWNGTVLDKRVNVGDHVAEGDVLYVVSDLSRVWVEFDAYESDLPVVNVGDEITFSVSAIPGRTFSGNVSFIDPVVDPRTRVARVRVEMNNEGQHLKPQMFAKGTILTTTGQDDDQLLIPRSAVLWTGQRSIVYRKLSEDDKGGATFQMEHVVLGPAIGNYYVVEEGLAPGAEIVINGAFTVDAAAQLSGKPSMMNTGDPDEEIHDLSNAPAPFREKTGVLITTYTTLKDHLVNSDFEQARKALEQVESALSAVPADVLDTSWKAWWTPVYDRLAQEIAAARDAENIDALRAAFIELSETMVEVGKTVDPLNNPLYIMRCPMANNNQGARWISLENEVKNPYYGDMMLSCGSVIETID